MMATLLVSKQVQVEVQNNAPLTVNNETGFPIHHHLEGSQRQSLSKDTTVEEKACSREIITSDPNEVNWNGPDDVENPQNWPVWRRTVIVGTVTAIVFTTYVHTFHFSHCQTPFGI